ncbi:MAG TPA: hypothetical protein VK917_06685 [Ilumatobacter sp.]|nr:hypothetical protein [Ilumatobacter sp.]
MARSPRHRRRTAAGLLAGFIAVVACGACASERDDAPMVDRIDDAIFAVESFYEAPQDFVEISATASVVSLIVDVDGGAEQAFWSRDDGLVEPIPIELVDRPTFRSGDLDFRPDRVLDQLREELPDSEIIDFAITGAGDGVVVYDARLQSERGGVLLVLLDGDGRILGAQGQ